MNVVISEKRHSSGLQLYFTITILVKKAEFLAADSFKTDTKSNSSTRKEEIIYFGVERSLKEEVKQF